MFRRYFVVHSLASLVALLWSGCDRPDPTPTPPTSSGVQRAALTSAVIIDASALTQQQLDLAGNGTTTFFDSKDVHQFLLEDGIPYALQMQLGNRFIGTLTVEGDGRIDYDPAVFTFDPDTNVLTVLAHPIEMNATSLTQQLLYVYGVGQDGFDSKTVWSDSKSLHLAAGTYTLLTQLGNVVLGDFMVGTDGTIDYAQSLYGTLSGRTTASLTITGKNITVQGEPEKQLVVYAVGDVFDSKAGKSFSVVPGSYQLETFYGVVIGSFTVGSDGLVGYDAALDGTFSGRDTTALTVRLPLVVPQCGVINPGDGLRPGESAASCNGDFRLVMQNNGRLYYELGSIPLTEFMMGDPPLSQPVLGDNELLMQPDGDFVLSAGGGNFVPAGSTIWHTNTAGLPGAQVLLQDSGVLALVWNGQTFWSLDFQQSRGRVSTFTSQTAESHRFVFLDHYGSRLPTEAIPQDLFQQGATSIVSTSDEHAETWVLDLDPATNPNGVRPIFWDTIDNGYNGPRPWPVANFKAVRLPYTVAVGDTQTTQFAAPFPTRTILNYDHGACYAKISYDELAAGLGGPLLHGAQDGCNGTLKADTNVAPLFQPNGLPQALQWGVSIGGHAYLGPTCSSDTEMGLWVMMQNYFAVDHVQPYTGATTVGTRVNVTSFNLWRGNDIPTLGYAVAPDFGWPVNDCIVQGVAVLCDDPGLSDFPNKFAEAINERLLLPDIGSLIANASYIQQGVQIPDDDLPYCPHGNGDCCPAGNPNCLKGPEDGCFHPDAAHKRDLINGSIVSSSANATASTQGMCVNRLQPKRVNLVPDGLEIVLAEDEQDPQFSTLQALSLATTSIRCETPPTAPINPAPVEPQEVTAGHWYGPLQP